MKFQKSKTHCPSSSTTDDKENPVSSLNHLFSATIPSLISVLSLQDSEVLAYMITRSLKSSTLNYSSSSDPCFDCDCFSCYTTFWSRWDCSPHRELIHQAIEAFEEHLSSIEKTKIKSMEEKASSVDVEERNSSGSHSPNNLIAVTDDDVEERETQVSAGEEEERESGTRVFSISFLWVRLGRTFCC
ncbi:unnamed protein product [Amaranthus hypochondriacus]